MWFRHERARAVRIPMLELIDDCAVSGSIVFSPSLESTAKTVVARKTDDASTYHARREVSRSSRKSSREGSGSAPRLLADSSARSPLICSSIGAKDRHVTSPLRRPPLSPLARWQRICLRSMCPQRPVDESRQLESRDFPAPPTRPVTRSNNASRTGVVLMSSSSANGARRNSLPGRSLASELIISRIADSGSRCVAEIAQGEFGSARQG